MRSLTIAGVDRVIDLERGTLEISQVLTYQKDTCLYKTKGDKPTQGEEIIVEDTSLNRRMFGGVIKTVDLERTFQDKSIKVWRVDCDDYTELVDKKRVVETYENLPGDEIFKDIAVKYCPDFTTSGVRSGAPVVEKIVFNYKKPSECFKELCDYIGWHWQPDYYKDLQFFSAEELAQPAPMDLEPGGYFRNFKCSIDTQGLRNRIYILGGVMLSNPIPVEWKADGVQRIWTIPFKPHETEFEVGETLVSLGPEFGDEPSSFDYLLNYQEKYIKCNDLTPTPIEGTTMRLVAKQNEPVITVVEDIESQSAIAAVQGGDGVYEHSITDDSLTTLDAAEAVGNADLRERANPRVSGSFDTEVDGWAPGQLVEIKLPDRGIEGTYLVQKVIIKSTPGTSHAWTYRIEYGGRLLGIADYLRALVSAQQKKQLAETTVISKITNVNEKVKVTDELALTTRQPPYYCGEADAICGFVECSGFFQICAADGLGILTGFEK